MQNRCKGPRRTELQHLWAVWSETLADVYGQALKYGRGPADIQEILTVESEIFALLEESEGLVAAGLNIVRERAGPIRLSDFVSGKPLPTEVIELMNWYGNLQDLIRRKEKKKKEIMREILKLKRRKKNDDLSG